MFSKLRTDWNDFFFSIRPATPLGLFRIAYGLVMLSWCMLQAPQLHTWYSQDGFFPLSAMRIWGEGADGIDILKYVTDFRITIFCFALLVLSAGMLTVGYRTRIASIVFWLLLASFDHRNMIILNGGDTMQRNLAFLLMFADSGAACSVDRLIRIARGQEQGGDTPVTEIWPQRLIMLQVSAVYISTIASKLEGTNWIDGTALYYALHLTDLQRFSLFGLREQLWFIQIMTYGTLFVEFSLATLLWVRRARAYILPLGVGLHLGIEYSMNVPLFAYTMIASYLVFVPESWVVTLTDYLHRQFNKNRIVLPERLSLSEPVSGLLTAMDSFRLVEFGESNARISPKLIWRVLWRLPATWAFVITPAAAVLVILPIRVLLIPFCIVWPLAMLYALTRLTERIAASIHDDPDMTDSSLIAESDSPQSNLPSIKQTRRNKAARARAAR